MFPLSPKSRQPESRAEPRGQDTIGKGTYKLPREVLRKIRRIEIRTNRMVAEGMAGEYHTVFKGRGMEFSEVREYEPGDDIRTIDWNVTSRTGTLHVKKFVEERDLTVVLAVDISGSQEFGSGYVLKRELAAEIGAVLAFSAARNHDRVGALLFTDRVEGYMPPSKGKDRALRIVRELLFRAPVSRRTALGPCLQTLHAMLRRRGVVFVISDFIDSGYERALKMLAQRHDVIAVRLRDPRESILPAAGLLRLRDAETGAVTVIDSADSRARRALEEFSRQEEEAWKSAFNRMGVDQIVLGSAEPYEQALVKFFRMREKRIARG